MGQYYSIYNLDKKERLGAIARGVKLAEMSSDFYTMFALSVLLANSNGRGGGDLYVDTYEFVAGKKRTIRGSKAKQAQIDVISGRWAGDRIVFQGDYAETADPGFISEENIEAFTDITQLCVDALRAGGTDLDDDKGFQITKSFGRVS